MAGTVCSPVIEILTAGDELDGLLIMMTLSVIWILSGFTMKLMKPWLQSLALTWVLRTLTGALSMDMTICLGRVCKVRHLILNRLKEYLSTLKKKKKETISSLTSFFRHFFLIALPYEILIPPMDYISIVYCMYIFALCIKESKIFHPLEPTFIFLS